MASKLGPYMRPAKRYPQHKKKLLNVDATIISKVSYLFCSSIILLM